MRAVRRRILIISAALLTVAIAGPLVAGSALSRPMRTTVGDPPRDLGAERITFASASGATLQGWFASGRPGRGAVLVLHGVRSDRRSMAGRASFLHRAGYAVLLFDFQAHSERSGWACKRARERCVLAFLDRHLGRSR